MTEQIAFRYMLRALPVLVGLAGLIGGPTMALGFLLGGLMGLLLFRLLVLDVYRLLDIQHQVPARVRSGCIRRYLLASAALVLGLTYDYIHFLGVLGGLLLPKAVIVGSVLWLRRTRNGS